MHHRYKNDCVVNTVNMKKNLLLATNSISKKSGGIKYGIESDL